MNDWLDPLRGVLDQSPRRVRFFFHDAGNGSDSGRLRAMLDVFASHRIAIDLAVNANPRGSSLDEVCPAPMHGGSEPVGGLVRRLAVAAASHERIGVLVDHSLITCDDLRLLDQLLTLVATHRRAECSSMQPDPPVIRAADDASLRALRARSTPKEEGALGTAP
jgi:hypothetical protein